MAVYVFLGHGGFDQKGTPGYPTEVLIPPDTSLKFYADAGQTLLLPSPSATNPNSGYERVAPVFDQVKDRGSPLTATMTTYNYCLYPDDSEKYRQSARRADWRGATPVFLPAGERYLCQGTPQTCPTPSPDCRWQRSRHQQSGAVEAQLHGHSRRVRSKGQRVALAGLRIV